MRGYSWVGVQLWDERPTAHQVNADRRLENQIKAENDAACSITADLQRVRKIVEGHKSLNVAAVNELERTCRVLNEALRPYHRSAFSLADLLGAIHEAGYEADCYDGDPSVFIGRDPKGRVEFHVALAQAAPRYAEAILKSATWTDAYGCLRWDREEMAKEDE